MIPSSIPARAGAVALGLALSASLSAAIPSATEAQEAVPTRIVVRVLANDAKIIGSGVGGAHVVIRDVETGEVLAQGLQEGGTGDTGDTGLIMGTRERHATTFDTDGAAALRAEIALSAPTMVEIEARGPQGAPHAIRWGATTVLMVPGEHLDGKGVLLNLNGFTVELLLPEEGAFVEESGEELEVRARVTMLCGCPTEPGGLWDSDDYDIRAQWVRSGRIVGETALSFSGTRSEYVGVLRARGESGPVILRVLALDGGRANTGMVEAPGRIR